MKMLMNRVNKSAVLFITGFCLYITIEVCYRGYSYPLMGLCGGMAFVLIDKINNKISWDIDILIQGLIGSAIITAFELLIGLMSLNGILPMMWDYSNLPLNYKGIICLPFSVVWVGISIIAVIIADAINYYFLGGDEIPYYRLFGKTILKFKEK